MSNKKYLYLDIETTGLDNQTERIIQLYMETSDGKKLNLIVNPGKESSKEALSKHGYTTDFLKDKPKLVDVIDQIDEFFKNCPPDEYIIVGHNSDKFDIPFIFTELNRVNPMSKYSILDYKFLDTLVTERYFFPMDLNSIYKRRTGKEIEDYHKADADVKATMEIHKSQMEDEKYDEDKLSKEIIDPYGRIIINNDGDPIWNMGKHRGKLIYDELNYLKWFLGLDDVPKLTEDKVVKLYEKYKPTL